jgi:hypothetical protein
MSKSFSQSAHSIASQLGAKLHLFSTPQEPGLPFNEDQPSQTSNTQSMLGKSKQEDEEYGRYQQELVPSTTHGLSSTKSCSLADTQLKPKSRPIALIEVTGRSRKDFLRQGPEYGYEEGLKPQWNQWEVIGTRWRLVKQKGPCTVCGIIVSACKVRR